MKQDLIDRQTEVKKTLYLEVMRIIATFFVIFNHTGNTGFFLFSQRPEGGLLFWIYLFISVFCKFSVPLFFAISGALMLNREDEPLKVLWKKRIFRFIVIILVFSFVYYVNSVYMDSGTIEIKSFLQKLYSDNLRAHLWYLYAYIAYLICLPFLRSLVRHLDKKYYYYMIGIALFFNAILPIIEYLLWKGDLTINGYIRATWLITSIVLYPCIGYFLQHQVDINSIKNIIPFLWLLNIVGIMVSCYMTYFKGQITGGFVESESQMFHNSFVLLNCISIFISIKYIFEHISVRNWLEKLIYSIGSCTFGIYLLHLIIIDRKFMGDLLTAMTNAGINYMIAVFIQCLCVMAVGYVITLILRRIPIVKKLVGG